MPGDRPSTNPLTTHTIVPTHHYCHQSTLPPSSCAGTFLGATELNPLAPRGVDERALFARWSRTGAFVNAHTIGTSTYRMGTNLNRGGLASAKGAFIDNLDQSVVLVGCVRCKLSLPAPLPPSGRAPVNPQTLPCRVNLRPHVKTQITQSSTPLSETL